MKDILRKQFTAIHRRSSRVLAGAPVDLVGISGFVAVATVLLAVVNVSSILVRALVGFPLLFLVPGYVTVSLLFPRAQHRRGSNGEAKLIAQPRDVNDVERAALSFGLSFALLPLLGLVIAMTPWGFTEPTVVVTISGFALIVAYFAIDRRLSIPASDRYQVKFGRRFEAAFGGLFDTPSSAHTAVNVVLVLSVVVALTTVGYALIAPQQGEEYTELQLLTEDESGDLVASGYPETIEPNETVSVTAAVENREREDMDYTLVVQEQVVADGEVFDRTTLDRFEMAVDDGSRQTSELEITPTTENGTVRIAVLLYDEEVPDTPTTGNAYRDAYFWTDVTEDAETDADEAEDADDGSEDEDGDDDEDDEDDEDADDEDDGEDEDEAGIFELFDDDEPDEGDEDDGDDGGDDDSEASDDGDDDGDSDTDDDEDSDTDDDDESSSADDSDDGEDDGGSGDAEGAEDEGDVETDDGGSDDEGEGGDGETDEDDDG